MSVQELPTIDFTVAAANQSCRDAVMIDAFVPNLHGSQSTAMSWRGAIPSVDKAEMPSSTPPGPLGLKLKKSKSLMDLISHELSNDRQISLKGARSSSSKVNDSDQLNYQLHHRSHDSPAIKRHAMLANCEAVKHTKGSVQRARSCGNHAQLQQDVKGNPRPVYFASTSTIKTEKRKAANCPVDRLQIGSWEVCKFFLHYSRLQKKSTHDQRTSSMSHLLLSFAIDDIVCAHCCDSIMLQQAFVYFNP